jgi:hypothetical protein
MSIETIKQLREVLVATGTSSLSPSLSPYLCCWKHANNSKEKKITSRNKSPRIKLSKRKHLWTTLWNTVFFYAGSKLMLGFEEREDEEEEEEEEEEDGGAWWIALLMLMSWIEFVDNSSDLLPHRM